LVQRPKGEYIEEERSEMDGETVKPPLEGLSDEEWRMQPTWLD